MKASFLKRVGSFVIDSVFLSILFTIITIGLNVDTKNISEEVTKTLKLYESGDITIDEYLDKTLELNYQLQKNSLVVNSLNIVLYVGYFMIFGYLNNGQTIGKKICKIQVVNNKGDKLSICNMIVRSLFIYGIFTLLYSVIFVNILNKEMFGYGYVIVSYLEIIFMTIAFFMILYKKDGRGIHDIIANTNVIEEVK